MFWGGILKPPFSPEFLQLKEVDRKVKSVDKIVLRSLKFFSLHLPVSSWIRGNKHTYNLVYSNVKDTQEIFIQFAYSKMFNTYCCSVSKLCLTLCNPMDCSSPGFPALHCLLEFAHTYVHWVVDDIQPSHPLLSASPPALNISQHQGTEIISKNNTGLKFTYIKKRGGSFSLKNSVVTLTLLFYREENMSFLDSFICWLNRYLAHVIDKILFSET